jgi:hypothetical protein
MFKLKTIANRAINALLHEQGDMYQREEIEFEPFSESDILKIYEILKTKQQFKTFLYRIIKQPVEYRESKIRKDRVLKDTEEIINSILNALYNEFSLDIPDRKHSLYASNSMKSIIEYGNNITIIFPGQKSKVIYNPNYSDSFRMTSIPSLYKYNISILLSKYFEGDAKNIYPNYYKFLNYIDRYRDNPDLDIILNDNIKFKSVILELKEFIDPPDPIRYQYNFFKNAIKYANEMEDLNKMDIFPPNKPIEFIIYGEDEYLQVNYYRFIESFEWSGNEWNPKI